MNDPVEGREWRLDLFTNDVTEDSAIENARMLLNIRICLTNKQTNPLNFNTENLTCLVIRNRTNVCLILINHY